MRLVADSSERTCASGFRSWSTFRGFAEQELYVQPCESEQAQVWALIYFAS